MACRQVARVPVRLGWALAGRGVAGALPGKRRLTATATGPTATGPSSCGLRCWARRSVRPFSSFKSGLEYSVMANRVLDDMNDAFEDLCDLHPDGADFDVGCADGVLNLDLGGRGTFVINKQTPNQQIWLSSPVSGPKRYDYDAARHLWVYSHDNVDLHTRLSEELTALLDTPVTLALPPTEEP